MATAKKNHDDDGADMSGSDMDDDLPDSNSPLTDESLDFSSLKWRYRYEFVNESEAQKYHKVTLTDKSLDFSLLRWY